jgi:hypothetical protein
MTSNLFKPSASWRAMTKNFFYLSQGLGGKLFRVYARRQCLIALAGMLQMSDDDLARHGTNRTALLKMQARLQRGDFPPVEPSAEDRAA